WRSRLRRYLQGLTWIFVIQLLSSLKRLVDFVIAIFLLSLFAPLLLLFIILLKMKGNAFKRETKVGRWCIPFEEYSFNLPNSLLGRALSKLGIHRLPVLFNILRGDMSFIGPRAAIEGQLSPRDRIARRRYNVRPGLLCLWWIRRRANINYGTEAD